MQQPSSLSPASLTGSCNLAVGLPVEVIERYLAFLNTEDLLCCSLACELWNSVILSNRSLVNKMRCFDNVTDYPGAFDQDNPVQLKFRLFKNWDYYKRLLLYYNCKSFANFASVKGVVQPCFSERDLMEGWTPLKFFLINSELHSIAISKRKDRLKLLRNERNSDTSIVDLNFVEPCTGCATALLTDQIAFGALRSFVYVYIIRSQPGVNVTLVSLDADMTQHLRCDLSVSDLSIDRDLGQGIKFLQVNGLTVLSNFIFFEVNCFNLTESRAVSYSMVLNVKQVAAVPRLELVGVVQTKQYNLNVVYHCHDRHLFILKCTHFKTTEQLYSSVVDIHNTFLSFHVLETHARELKYYAFWLNYLLFVDESRKRVHFWHLQTAQNVYRLNECVENNPGSDPLVSVVNGDIMSVRTKLNYLFVQVSLGVTRLMVFRLEEVLSNRLDSHRTLIASSVSEFTFDKNCKDLEVVGCHNKQLNVVLH